MDLLRTHQNVETCYKTDKTDIQTKSFVEMSL